MAAMSSNVYPSDLCGYQVGVGKIRCACKKHHATKLNEYFSSRNLSVRWRTRIEHFAADGIASLPDA